MGLIKKLHDKLFLDEERVPPPPAPGHHHVQENKPSIGTPPPPSQHPAFSQSSVPQKPPSAPPPVPQYTPTSFLEPKPDTQEMPDKQELPPGEVPFTSDPMTNAHKTTPPKGLPEVPGLTVRIPAPSPEPANDIKEHPAHDTPFFSQEITTDKPAIEPKPAEKPVSVVQPKPASTPKTPVPASIVKQEPPSPSPQSETLTKQESSETHWEKPPTFHLSDGRVAAGPTSLAFIADDMSDEVFSHHVTADRNDFATWIENGLKDRELAQKVRGATSPKELSAVLRGHQGAVIKNVSSDPLPTIEKPALDKPEIDVSSLKQSFDAIAKELERAAHVKKSIEEQQVNLEERENDLIAREHAFSETLKSFEAEREKTQQALKETARLRDELRKRHVELAELALSLDAQQDRLRVSSQRKEPSLSHDVRKDSFAQVATAPAPQVPAADIHAVLDLVERAHRCLVEKRVSESRELYSQARELFYATNLPEEERRELYNLIRELYTDIELTRMN